jgi:hypothetical protein
MYNQNIPAPHREALNFLLGHFHNKMMDQKLEYWLEGGALLGFYRNGKFIGHDDDLDVCLERKTLLNPAFNEVLNFMKTLSVTIPSEGEDPERTEKVIVENNQESKIIKICIPNMWAKLDSGKIIGTPTLDIFCREVKKKRGEIASYRLFGLPLRLQFPNCYFLENEIFPLNIVQIEGVSCLVPNNGLPYLLRYYGRDCLQTIKVEERAEEDWLSKKYKK